jgi:hypothetical protein
MKEEENNLIFKPQTNQVTMDMNKVGGANFLDRVSYHKNKVDNKIKEKRSQRVDKNENEYTFHPTVTDKAKKIGKRTVNDLIVT